jgi:hypothetical protein
MYSSTFSLSRHYLEVSGQHHAPAALPPGKEPLVSISQIFWALEPIWTTLKEKVIDTTGIQTPNPP